jgi:hypothetical protein
MVTVEEVVGVLAAAIVQLRPEEAASEGSAFHATTAPLAPDEGDTYYALIGRALQDRLITSRQAEALRCLIHTWEVADSVSRCLAQQLLEFFRTTY